jgi:hypothetical protein
MPRMRVGEESWYDGLRGLVWLAQKRAGDSKSYIAAGLLAVIGGYLMYKGNEEGALILWGGAFSVLSLRHETAPKAKVMPPAAGDESTGPPPGK